MNFELSYHWQIIRELLNKKKLHERVRGNIFNGSIGHRERERRTQTRSTEGEKLNPIVETNKI